VCLGTRLTSPCVCVCVCVCVHRSCWCVSMCLSGVLVVCVFGSVHMSCSCHTDRERERECVCVHTCLAAVLLQCVCRVLLQCVSLCASLSQHTFLLVCANEPLPRFEPSSPRTLVFLWGFRDPSIRHPSRTMTYHYANTHTQEKTHGHRWRETENEGREKDKWR